jgi:hypothetical protein
MKPNPKGIRTEASNPTGPTEYMGSYTLIKHTQVTTSCQGANRCQQN